MCIVADGAVAALLVSGVLYCTALYYNSSSSSVIVGVGKASIPTS